MMVDAKILVDSSKSDGYPRKGEKRTHRDQVPEFSTYEPSKVGVSSAL